MLRCAGIGRNDRYLLDGLSVVAQYAPGGQRQAWYTQSLARIDEVLNVANDAGKFWYQADALGSVYGLTNQPARSSGVESARVSRRLPKLRGWSHGKEGQVSGGGS